MEVTVREFLSAYIALCFGTAGVLFAATGLAQVQQTPAGAQQFLEKTLTGMAITVDRHQYPDGQVFERLSGYIEEYVPDGECDYRLKAKEVRDGQITTIDSPRNFRAAILAEKRDSSVFLSTKGNAGLTVHVGSEALADRVVYAMNFLIQHCDRAADTGF